MAGLLDLMPQDNWYTRGMNNPLTHIGMGLAQSLAPRYSTNVADLNGGGIGAGLLSGMGSYNAYQGQQQDRALKGGLLQAKQAEAELKRQKLEAEMGKHERLKKRAMTLLSGLSLEMQQKLAPLAETAPEEFISQVGGLLGAKPEAKYSDPYTMPGPDGKPILVRKNLTNNKVETMGGGGVNISLPEERKIVGKDASSYVYPDGSQPLPTETPSDIVAKGGRLLSQAELSARKTRIDIEERKRVFKEIRDEKKEEYDKAKAAYNANPSMQNKRNFDDASFALRNAQAQHQNVMGEPSDAITRQVAGEPGAVGTAVDAIIDPLLGATKQKPAPAAPQGLLLEQKPPNWSDEDWAELQKLRRGD